MNQSSGKLEYWAMLFMLSETVTAEWTDELHQMLQTEVPQIPDPGLSFTLPERCKFFDIDLAQPRTIFLTHI